MGSHAQFRAHEVAQILVQIREEHPHISEEDAAKLAAYRAMTSEHKSRAHYRIAATRGISGGRRVDPSEPVLSGQTTEGNATPKPMSNLDPKLACIAFDAAAYSVMENAGEVVIGVQRMGNTSIGATIKYNTKEGTATDGSDYVGVSGTLDFAAGETTKSISVKLIDDVEWEPDEDFFVHLSDGGTDTVVHPELGVTRVTIVNDDDPGIVQFAQATMSVSETCGKAQIHVLRKEGSSGEVSVTYSSKNGSAVAEKDYEAVQGTLTFAHGETDKVIEVVIVNDNAYEKDENFSITMENPTNHAQLIVATVTVTIKNSEEMKSLTDNVTKLLGTNQDKFKLGSANYADQFRDAVSVSGGEDGEKPSAMDYVSHVFSVF